MSEENQIEDDDADFIGDITISLSDDLFEQDDAAVEDTSRIISDIHSSGGVNRDIAVAMESMQPGVLTDHGVPLNSFTREYSRTNYRVTLEEAEGMGMLARVAIIIGAGAIATLLTAWIWKTFFDDGEGGSSGGKRGADRDKAIEEAMHRNREFKSELEKAWRLYSSKRDKLTDADKKEWMAENAPVAFKAMWKNRYSGLIDELGKGKGNHVATAGEITDKIPTWMKQIEDAQNKLIGLVTGGKGDQVKIEEYVIKIELNGGGDMKVARDRYKELAKPNPELAINLDDDYTKTSGIGKALDKLDGAEVKKFEEWGKKIKEWGESMKSNPNKATGYTDAAAKAQQQLRDAVKAVGHAWAILGMIQKAQDVIADVMVNQYVSMVKKLDTVASAIEKELEGTELEQSKEHRASIAKFLGSALAWGKKKITGKDKDGKPAPTTEPAKPAP